MGSRRVSAARRAAEKYRYWPATPTDHIWHLPEFIADFGKLPAVLIGRVSGKKQVSDGNLTDILADLRCVAEAYKLQVVDAIGEQGRGWLPLTWRHDLVRARDLAAQHGAFILAPSSTRLLRHPQFHPFEKPHVLPTVAQFCELARFGRGVKFATVLHPDLGWEDVRRHEILRGKRARTAREGGRAKTPGYKKRIRDEKLDRALALRDDEWSYSRIAKAVRVPRSTVQDWIRIYG